MERFRRNLLQDLVKTMEDTGNAWAMEGEVFKGGAVIGHWSLTTMGLDSGNQSTPVALALIEKDGGGNGERQCRLYNLRYWLSKYRLLLES